jgi:SAM-dependent methyltransferase
MAIADRPLSEAQYYEQSSVWERAHERDHDELLRLASVDDLLPVSVRSILDVGAGDGLVLHHLLDARPGLVGFAAERSWTAISLVRAPSVLSSGDGLPLRSRGCDAVVCCEVLEHLPPPVYDATRSELARVADRYVVVTVPNNENRARSSVDCPSCGCRYNRHRHLRSFTRDTLATLVPGFALTRVTVAGPRPPVYPRALRSVLERRRLLSTSGDPVCPQCGTRYRASSDGAPAAAGRQRAGAGVFARLEPLGRRLLPRAREPYWLCGLFERRD